MEPLLNIEDLSIDFHTKDGIVSAVRNVNLKVMPGQIIGLAGESGSGKSTIGLSILRLLHENGRISSGKIDYKGVNIFELKPKEMRQLRWKEISMVFQGAMNAFNPVRKMRTQLTDVLTLRLKMSKKEAEKRAINLMKALGIDEKRIDNYPHEFSGGMRQRAMMVMALVCNPQLVIADEPTTALDVMVKAQMIELLRDLRTKFNISMIIISHDLTALAEVCDDIAIMNQGELVEYGSTSEIFYHPKHPYTQHLINSIPRLEEPVLKYEMKEDDGIENKQALSDTQTSCVFVDHCMKRSEICYTKKPKLVEQNGGYVKCNLYTMDGGGEEIG
jgi:peptide/nickel transport system ATP-binding protein